MIPSAYVWLDALPLTPNGKIDRKALPAPGASRAEDTSSNFVAPRNESELQLAQLWEEVLNVKRVGVRDNFFELGGHSLLAVKLFSRIEQATGATLPMSSLFDGATVEQQAKLLGQPRAASNASSLVAIQPQGERPPLFCAHPWGGNVLCYTELAKRLGTQQPVYGLQARGVERKENAHDSIEEMAADYLSEIRALQPFGPYQLCGWSSGGLIAFEMARQLEQQGQRVGLLALIDTYDMTELYTRSAFDEKDASARASNFSTEAQIVTYTGQTVFAHVNYDERIGLTYKVPSGLGLAQSRHFLNDYVGYYLHVDRAIQGYAPRPFGGRAVHFWTASRLAKATAGVKQKWSSLANGGMQIHEVPGEHFTILREPNVQTLAGQLQNYLERGPTGRA
jgi:thioesterase domain-containing protein/acyl carrier protein